MSVPLAESFSVEPLEAFRTAIDARRVQVDFLLEHLSTGLEVVSDLERVNAAIGASARPELLLTDPAPQIQITFPYRRRLINNFTPSMRAFGPRLVKEEIDWRTNEPRMVYAGRARPSRKDLDLYFFMGARGDYHQHHAFAEANGIDREDASDMLLQTHIAEEAFMRMWIALPDLTEKLMLDCLDERGADEDVEKSIYEEVFVAYSIMSKLVDKNDRGVVKSDGTIDDWKLCH